MISKVTNALPAFLKKMKTKENELDPFNLIESIKFYASIMGKDNKLCAFSHIYLDFIFEMNDNTVDLLNSFNIDVSSFNFLRDFSYSIDNNKHLLVIRGNLEELATLSMVLIGSIKDIQPDVPNKSVFVSMCELFLKFCINSGYNVCKESDINVLEEYNSGFNEKLFKHITVLPTPDSYISSYHFIGIQLLDVIKIFEKYKNIKFTYNKENAAFIITMSAFDWNDYWTNIASEGIKNELVPTILK